MKKSHNSCGNSHRNESKIMGDPAAAASALDTNRWYATMMLTAESSANAATVCSRCRGTRKNSNSPATAKPDSDMVTNRSKIPVVVQSANRNDCPETGDMQGTRNGMASVTKPRKSTNPSDEDTEYLKYAGIREITGVRRIVFRARIRTGISPSYTS